MTFRHIHHVRDLALVALLALIVSVAGCDVLRSPAQRGMNDLKRGDYVHAVDAFGRAITDAQAKGDQSAEAIAYANRCFARDAAGYHEEAVADCTAALAIKPDDVEILNNRGVVYLSLKRLDEAEADFNAAIDKRPDYAEAYANRGRLDVDRENFDLAVKDLTRAIELNDGLAEAYANRAFAQDSLGNVEEALADYTAALARHADALTYFERGMLQYRYGHFEDAYQDFKQSAALEPESYVGYMARSQADLLESNPEARKATPEPSPSGGTAGAVPTSNAGTGTPPPPVGPTQTAVP
jgi:tetratricopeptide (TPR) repeat protein